jgi:hypothetical protein
MIVMMMRHREITDRFVREKLLDLGDNPSGRRIAIRCFHHEHVVLEADNERVVIGSGVHRVDVVRVLRA